MPLAALPCRKSGDDALHPAE